MRPGSVFLGSGRPHWSCGPGRTCRSGWSSRTGRPSRARMAAVLYDDVFRIRPRRDLDDACRGKLWSDPPKSSSRSALDLHRFGGTDFDLHVRLARPPDPSYDDQLAPRDAGSCNQYFGMRAFTPCDYTRSDGSCDSADDFCEHGRASGHNLKFSRLAQSEQDAIAPGAAKPATGNPKRGRDCQAQSPRFSATFDLENVCRPSSQVAERR